MPNLVILTIVAGIAGGVAHMVIGVFWYPPLLVGACIAGSVGYIAAWAVELYMSKRQKPPFNMDYWGR